MSQRKNHTYDAEFIERAVTLAVESDSRVQVARDSGVGKNTLYRWIRQYHQQPKAAKKVNDEHVFDEPKRLRKEDACLKEERDNLKNHSPGAPELVWTETRVGARLKAKQGARRMKKPFIGGVGRLEAP